MVKYLLLDVTNFAVVLMRRAVHGEDDLVPEREVDVVQDGHGHEEEHDKHPAVVDEDVLQAAVFEPGEGDEYRGEEQRGRRSKVTQLVESHSY